ncbi:uncharacterized protein CLUP02_12176 [Colletotrichum lupini]|uniref:Uncharacterized protein n=1 Tax=Colletotrichum lupini TaxID=145971 RepID=A0A9Q8SZV9_9PEZI|nr:uncharacterized protein CLUP02_12176 [Colletotrichum lupini]UQC86674.1 hypothetical protein CLUP02_12176 [Colletotrichum lupini]
MLAFISTFAMNKVRERMQGFIAKRQESNCPPSGPLVPRAFTMTLEHFLDFDDDILEMGRCGSIFVRRYCGSWDVSQLGLRAANMPFPELQVLDIGNSVLMAWTEISQVLVKPFEITYHGRYVLMTKAVQQTIEMASLTSRFTTVEHEVQTSPLTFAEKPSDLSRPFIGPTTSLGEPQTLLQFWVKYNIATSLPTANSLSDEIV